MKICIFLAIVCHKGVNRSLGEEELVSRVVDFLPPEIPAVSSEIALTGFFQGSAFDADRRGKRIRSYLDSIGGCLRGSELILGVSDFTREGGFSSACLANYEKLGLTEII